MKRSGGKSGRPMGDWTIDQLEDHVSAHEYDLSELAVVRSELGYRSTKRSAELKDLVDRMIRNPEPRGLL
ncbi:hypothetical protein AAG596_10605 [Citromicrobium bathyomarinum]|uniref:hypothetical protein n=1 Tax=Citromicrobium bathyomarinum TaxID=72174 RepID=UPI00315A3287